jgi:23S rRNA (cytosine1962-C5)-methyltransferase
MSRLSKFAPNSRNAQEGPACQDRNGSRHHDDSPQSITRPPNHSSRWISPDLFHSLVEKSTTAFRIAETPAFSIDRFGDALLVSLRQPATDWKTPLETWTRDIPWSPSRIFERQLVPSPGEKDTPGLVTGDPSLPPLQTVLESGLRYEVDFHSGYNPGLFPDQRANRDFLRSLAAHRVLNTFAHTCAFSVAAASVGAETTSVDISKSSLARGRRNFELNALPLASHRFIAEDVATYLRRLAKRGESFDAILLDPPTFGRGGGGKTFRIQRDFPTLLAAALDIAAPRAAILLSTNFSEWTPAHLAREAARLAPAASFREIPPPPDFLGQTPSSTIWMFP